ncbi:MAG: InlB B-repeat-containing protein, partial [Bacillota bacterium]
LRNLFCQNCGLNALDLSHAPDLYYLDCSKNALPSLNTGANTFLAYYFCNGNLLSSLDASANPNLVYLDFSANRLKLIKAKVSGRNITLQANTGGYVELFGTIDESVLNASGAPFAGASFFNWTAGSSIVSTDAAYPLSGGGDVSLLANFAYTVTFDKNGGETGPDSVAVLCGGILDAPPVQPTRAGYTFGGWYKEQACATIWNFSADTVDENTVLYAKWTALPITDLPQTYTMYKSGRVTWNPQPSGGTWDWDEDFFSAAFNGGATFTALKTGTSTITYTFGGSTQSVTITIMPAELPATGQDFTWVYILLGLAVCMLGTGIFFDKRASRKKRV